MSSEQTKTSISISDALKGVAASMVNNASTNLEAVRLLNQIINSMPTESKKESENV